MYLALTHSINRKLEILDCPVKDKNTRGEYVRQDVR